VDRSGVLPPFVIFIMIIILTSYPVADVDDSYRMTVIEKIKGLMDEVEVIHKKEEVQLQKRLVSLLYCSFLFDYSCKANRTRRQNTVKKSLASFPSPAGMSLTKLSLGRNNDVIYKLFPARESLVSDIRAEDRNIANLFF